MAMQGKGYLDDQNRAGLPARRFRQAVSFTAM